MFLDYHKPDNFFHFYQYDICNKVNVKDDL